MLQRRPISAGVLYHYVAIVSYAQESKYHLLMHVQWTNMHSVVQVHLGMRLRLHSHFTTEQDITKFRVKNQISYCKLQQNPHNQSLINAPEYHWKVTHGRKSELLGGPEGFSEVVHFQGVKECSRLWSGAG